MNKFHSSKKIKPKNLLYPEIFDKLTPQKINIPGRVSPHFGMSKHKAKPQEFIKRFTAYNALTHKGIYRNYNEDRVSVILNIVLEDENETTISNCSLFSLFDGHAGALCANFLKEKLHHFITEQDCFVEDKLEALRLGILSAETTFWKLAQSGVVLDISGSCAIITLIEGETMYIANVGDSRTIISKERGVEALQLTTDHKPEDEVTRIRAAGGNIFQNKRKYKKKNIDEKTKEISIIEKERVGPWRVSPGGLSVSRTIGDLPSKDCAFGGNNMCLIATPELKKIKIEENMDFLIMGCDGVFDELNNDEVIVAAWKGIEHYIGKIPLKEVAKKA